MPGESLGADGAGRGARAEACRAEDPRTSGASQALGVGAFPAAAADRGLEEGFLGSGPGQGHLWDTRGAGALAPFTVMKVRLRLKIIFDYFNGMAAIFTREI